MEDVRLTATNPADSSIVPVACNDKGELLLEEPITGPPGEDGEDGAQGEQGPQGERGPQGEQGPAGVDGKDGKDGKDGEDGQDGQDGIDGVQLPPDPYEGALLGWLNNELAWIGTPPVPIPENVFGPITDWDPDSGAITVAGDIPASIGNGVYIYQCDENGVKFTDGWNVSRTWSNSTLFAPTLYTGSIQNVFDSDDGTGINASSGTSPIDNCVRITFTSIVNYSSAVAIKFLPGQMQGQVNDRTWTSGGTNTELTIVSGMAGSMSSVAATEKRTNAGYDLTGILVDYQLLVDEEYSLNMRVNQVLNNLIIGVPNNSKSFVVGRYLMTPPQRVAPWVLYEGDPTSRIDYLRSKRD